MTITVFGATGQVGKQIVVQALAKGYTVRAFGRNVDALIDEDQRNNNLEALQGYVFDEGDILSAVEDTDVVISALGGAFDGTDKTRSLGIKNIIAQMDKAGIKRIVALGGKGVLNAPDDTYLMDAPGYPEEFKPVGREHLQAYLYLKESDLDWTFVCSPDIKSGPATDHYITSATYPPTTDNNYISSGDLADFMIKEAEEATFNNQRAGISAV